MVYWFTILFYRRKTPALNQKKIHHWIDKNTIAINKIRNPSQPYIKHYSATDQSEKEKKIPGLCVCVCVCVQLASSPGAWKNEKIRTSNPITTIHKNIILQQIKVREKKKIYRDCVRVCAIRFQSGRLEKWESGLPIWAVGSHPMAVRREGSHGSISGLNDSRGSDESRTGQGLDPSLTFTSFT